MKVGVVALDGTKVRANASNMANVDYRRLAEEILAEAARVDAEQDALYGEARGDELPEQVRTAEGRREALREEATHNLLKLHQHRIATAI